MLRIAICLVVAACGGSATGDDDDDGVDANVPTPLSSDEATRACAIFGSCLGDGINDCFTDAMPYWTSAEARCMLAAGGDCVAIRACFGFAAMADPSCSAKVTTCDGTNLVTCADGVRSTISCPDASPLLRAGTGATCVVTSTGALCGDASCSADSATCSGTVASNCVAAKGVQISVDCADYAQTCSGGGCTSAGGGGACTAGTLPRCDGAQIVRCGAGAERTTDCGAIANSATCYPGTGTTSPDVYCGFGDACYPTKGTETCMGTSVTFCGAGVVTTIDCTTLGFTRCFSGACASF